MYSKTEPALDEFITFKLLRLTNRFSRQSVRILARHSELRLPEWRCLAIVEAYGKRLAQGKFVLIVGVESRGSSTR